MNLISELKRIRQSKKVSIKRLAEMSGVHRQTVEAWEYKNVTPTIDTFDKALNALGYELKICKIEEDKL